MAQWADTGNLAAVSCLPRGFLVPPWRLVPVSVPKPHPDRVASRPQPQHPELHLFCFQARLGSRGKRCLVTTRNSFPTKSTPRWRF